MDRESLHAIREAELSAILPFIPEGGRVLEIGGGTGHQARLLSERGMSIVSVDIKGSPHRNYRVFDIIEYDGCTLPFPSASFDMVLCSHVLEVITDLAALYQELGRVLRVGGSAIHVVGTHWWRIWTNASHYPDLAKRSIVWCLSRTQGVGLNLSLAPRKPSSILRTALVPRVCGPRGNVTTEIAYFPPIWWRRNFHQHGWTIIKESPIKLFYTGNAVLGTFLNIQTRQRIAHVLGSASHLFHVSPINNDDKTP